MHSEQGERWNVRSSHAPRTRARWNRQQVFRKLGAPRAPAVPTYANTVPHDVPRAARVSNRRSHRADRRPPALAPRHRSVMHELITSLAGDAAWTDCSPRKSAVREGFERRRGRVQLSECPRHCRRTRHRPARSPARDSADCPKDIAVSSSKCGPRLRAGPRGQSSSSPASRR